MTSKLFAPYITLFTNRRLENVSCDLLFASLNIKWRRKEEAEDLVWQLNQAFLIKLKELLDCVVVWLR